MGAGRKVEEARLRLALCQARSLKTLIYPEVAERQKIIYYYF